MKKYTLEQLKTEKIAIHTPTPEIYDALMKKFEEKNISWVWGEKATSDNVFLKFYKKNTNIFFDKNSTLNAAHTLYCERSKYTIITPDQIDWGEEEKKGIYHTERSIVLREYMPLPYSGPKQSKTPAVFIKAQKDWNGFKAFLKEVEAYGRTLTSAQLKDYMAKDRKLRGGK